MEEHLKTTDLADTDLCAEVDLKWKQKQEFSHSVESLKVKISILHSVKKFLHDNMSHFLKPRTRII